jgi:hypothetical protein
VNVALKTSFGAPPYLIELLLVLPFAVRPDIL